MIPLGNIIVLKRCSMDYALSRVAIIVKQYYDRREPLPKDGPNFLD